MLSKPLSLFLVYILIICNFALLLLPFLLAILPFSQINGDEISLFRYISFSPKIALFFLIFIISFLMIIYLIIDFIFGFSVRFSLKGCKNYRKEYGFLKGIFSDVKYMFDQPNLKLYIKNDDEVNAFAIAGMRRKAVVLTSGLINHYMSNIEDNEECLIAIRSILGHEASHLINKDYLPGMLMIINQKATNIASFVLTFVFQIFIRIFSFLKMEFFFIAIIMRFISNMTTRIVNLFNRLILMNLYQFLKNIFGRAVEYRCDRQSAKAFGGVNMAHSLSLLGKSGYFTLFSTHPATQKRIKKVQTVEEKNAIIGASFSSQFTNYVSILILPFVCATAAHLSKVDLAVKYFVFNNYPDFYYSFLSLLNFANN
ncbi:MAG: Zn-dependent protease with chaperone function [Rickettsiales bacterium]|jgi:Zn-dependent protease with chaperone function